MSRWRKLNHWMLDLDTFYHLYLLILLNAMYEGGVQLGCVVLGEGHYIRSIGRTREDLFLKVRIRPFCKGLVSERYEYGGVYTFKPMNDLACGIRMFVKRGCNDSGIDQLDNKADSGMSSCGEKRVNRVRK
ncbi:hypothetical protein [Rossellomorea sp. KS-H15a]|uniref:hypothetical protein n=1 Tax=Rossellomorea sp. KS-H15a TaxID=2963940 RepID=UPI0020C6993A|nr:hypothetical protein [Rossellomorea sp. KS-H15a]UTE76763.1 hypothetical protein M1J35_19760 [Rossellomorea sp. KS-H15a]